MWSQYFHLLHIYGTHQFSRALKVFPFYMFVFVCVCVKAHSSVEIGASLFLCLLILFGCGGKKTVHETYK